MQKDLIIDSHLHCESLKGSHWDSPPQRLLKLMDEAGIRLSLIMTYTDYPSQNPGGREEIQKACEKYPLRFRGFIRLDPLAENACDILEDAIANRGFIGLKLHPVGFLLPPSHPAIVQLANKCSQLKAPLLFHCGDEEFTLPFQFEPLARKCPDTTIILGHMGGYFHVEEAIELAEKYPNIILETSATPRVALIRHARERIGAERILFASDGPGCLPQLELKKIQLCKFTTKDYKKITFLNACEVFGAKRLGF
ncbi:amidohydrolase family protein [Candidatus Riflebacteria bacterium]